MCILTHRACLGARYGDAISDATCIRTAGVGKGLTLKSLTFDHFPCLVFFELNSGVWTFRSVNCTSSECRGVCRGLPVSCQGRCGLFRGEFLSFLSLGVRIEVLTSFDRYLLLVGLNEWLWDIESVSFSSSKPKGVCFECLDSLDRTMATCGQSPNFRHNFY